MVRPSVGPAGHTGPFAATRSFLAGIVFRNQPGGGATGGGGLLPEEMAAIQEVARIITSTLDIDQVYEKFAAEVKKLVGFDQISVNVVGIEAGTVTIRYLSGIHSEGRDQSAVVPLEGTCTERLVHTGMALRRDDIRKGDSFAMDPGRIEVGLRSSLIVPLFSKASVIGSLNLHSSQELAYGPREQTILERLADQIAPAVENARLYDQLQTSMEEKAVVDEVARIITSTLDIDQVYEKFAAEVKKLVDFDRLALTLANRDAAVLVPNYVSGVLLEGEEAQPSMPLAGSITGWVIQTGRALLRADINVVDGFWNDPARLRAGLRSSLAVPLRSKDTITGMLQVLSCRASAYGSREQAILELLADQIAPAVENARLHRQVQANAEEKAVVDEVARIITSTLDIDQVYERFAAEVKKLVDFDRINISLIDRDAGTYAVQYLHCLVQPGRRAGDIMALPRNHTEQVMVTDEAVITKYETTENEFPADPALRKLGLRSRILLPLHSKGTVIGILALHSRRTSAYGPREHSILELLADQIAPAVENARLYAEITRESEEREMLAEIGRIIGSSLDIEQVFEPFSEQAQKLIPFDRIVVNVIDVEQRTYANLFVGGVGVSDRRRGDTGLITGTQAEAVVRSKSSLLVQPKDRDELVSRLPGLAGNYDAGLRSFLSVPLVSGDRIIAALNLRSTMPRAYSNRHVVLAEAVAGQIAGAITNSQLYSRRLDAEAALRESEERFRGIFEESPVGVCLVDEGSRIIEANRAFCQMLGYAEEDLIGGTLADITHPEDIGASEALLAKTLSGEIPGYEIQERHITKDQETIWVKVTAGAVQDSTGEPVYTLGIVEDITERKSLQEQLVQSQKMEVFGQLAGGVAHDFNNLLTPLLGFSEMAAEAVASGEPMLDYLDQVQDAAKRASKLTQQLLAFSRRQIVEPAVVNLNDLVANTEKMLRRLIGENIELELHPALDLGMVKVDTGQMEQVLVNLFVNARDAMPRGGKLTVETANVALDTSSALEFAQLAAGRYVKLSIDDTGVGMDEEVKQRLFEPFFTTKEPGRGTGLGLATCHGIVKECGGEIRVWSQPGRGTTFDIFLPRAEGAAAPAAVVRQPDLPPQGTETVLLVEDEPSVRFLAAEVLRRQGYTVLEAANGEEALRVGHEHRGEEISLLLTDVVMPQMGGRELAECLEPLMPRMKVLFTSGFLDELVFQEAALDPGFFFIPKPFAPKELTRKVRELLDRDLSDGRP